METAVRKEVLMVKNVKLLGFEVDDAGAAAHGPARSGPELHANAFDRPNEKLLLRVLHFLLVTLSPDAAQEFRFCWPIATPHDKSSFKRLVQTKLQDLEKNRHLPVGSSQASRINTGYGPRAVDLLWRLSTHVLKTMLKRNFPAYTLRPPPSSAEISNAEAIIATKSLIASKTKLIKDQYVQRSQLQDEWCEFAAEMTAKIQELNSLQQKVQEEQARLDSTVYRDVFSQVKTEQRSSKLRNIERAWDLIDQLTEGDEYNRNKAVLATALQYSEDQPVLSAVKMQPDGSVGNHSGQMNLADVVRDAEQFIQAVRHRVAAAKTEKLVQSQTSLDSSSLVDACTHHIAQLNTMIQRIQKLLAQIKESNDEDARRLYLELADSGAADSNMMAKSAMKLCPPTPALPAHEQHKLVNSMKNITMAEMSGREKQIKREQLHQIEASTGGIVAHDQATEPDTNSGEVIRQLKYEDIDHGDQDME